MSSAASSSTISEDDLTDAELELLHYANEKTRLNGGEYEVNELVFSIGPSSVDIDLSNNEIHEYIKGDRTIANGNTKRLSELIQTKTRDQREFIIDVEPVGDVPEVIQRELGTQSDNSLESLSLLEDSSCKEEFIASLKQAGIDTIDKLADADPETVQEIGEDVLREQAREIDWEDFDGLTSPECDALEKQGIKSEYDLLDRSTEEIRNQDSRSGATIPEAKVEMVKAEIESKGLRTMSVADAQDAISTAVQNKPIGPELAEKALSRHRDRVEEIGEPQAIVTDLDQDDETVGQPLVETSDDLTLSDEEAVYMADLGINDDSPVNTGLPVLEDNPDYDKIPRPETEDSGDASLPVNDDGEVVKPAIPVEEYRQAPLDQCIAMALADGDNVCIEGERGVGKNYLIRYLAHKTNRGYRSFDANRDMTPTDLFGPIAPTEDGMLEPKNVQLKKGLLNGDLVVIDEFSAMNPGVTMSLHQLLEDNEIAIPSHGQYVKPHPEARIIITKNPPTDDYKGNNEQNQATKGRFSYYWQTYPDSVTKEATSLDQQLSSDKIDYDTIMKVVEFAHRTRKPENENWPVLSTRDVKAILKEIRRGFPVKGCIMARMKKRETMTSRTDSAESVLNSII